MRRIHMFISAVTVGLAIANGCSDDGGDTVESCPPGGVGGAGGAGGSADAGGAPQFLPVPKESATPPFVPGEVTTVKLADGAYMLTSNLHEMLFFTTGEGVIAVDAPEDIGANIPTAIAAVTSEPITHVIYSHAHKDHIGAADVYPPTATVIAHEETAKILTEAADPHRPVPSVTFAGNTRYTLEVGNTTLHLDYKGPNHQAGNIFIYSPQHKVLMAIDIVFDNKWTPFKNLGMAQSVPGYIKAFDQILEYDFDKFIGGHLGNYGTPEGVRLQRDFIQDLKKASLDASAMIDFVSASKGVDPANPWAQFKVYSDQVDKKCAELMPAKWKTLLAGTDVFLQDNCFVLNESLRLD